MVMPVFGNTFLMNRHAIAGGGDAHESYRAWYNLVLSEAPLQLACLPVIHCPANFYTHDFDMHGTGSDGFGGRGAYFVDIVGTTFLGTNRHNFEWRGIPCQNHNFSSNVSLESTSDALNFKTSNTQVSGSIEYITITDTPYQFEHANPTARLGVGDFDNDGADDLFLATGAAWYYAPAGSREWRFLSAKTDTIDQLLLGDFDGDGRTDVVAIHDRQFVISWGGISEWEVLNADPTGGRILLLPDAVSAMAIGDFDGDRRADIFYADGITWWVSYGGYGPFVPTANSSFQVKDLRFGDFDGDGATDVFGVVSNGQFNTWSYSKSATGSWADGYLRPALADTVDGLVVADFNGDGFADVAMNCDGPACWRISYGGFQDWTYLSEQNSGLLGPQFVAVGHFLGHAAADVLTWNLYFSSTNSAICNPNAGRNTYFCISQAAIYPGVVYSTQDMR